MRAGAPLSYLTLNAHFFVLISAQVVVRQQRYLDNVVDFVTHSLWGFVIELYYRVSIEGQHALVKATCR